MLIYGAYAEKYFDTESATRFGEITPDEKAAIVKNAVPEDYTYENQTELNTGDLKNYQADSTNFESGYYGTTAVLADSLHVKVYFYGMAIDTTKVTVTMGEELVAADKVVAEKLNDSEYTYVKVAIDAKDFDTAITIGLKDAGDNDLGTVTDSLAAYTSRIVDKGVPTEETPNDGYYIAQAVRDYGYYAMEYANHKS